MELRKYDLLKMQSLWEEIERRQKELQALTFVYGCLRTSLYFHGADNQDEIFMAGWGNLEIAKTIENLIKKYELKD